MTRLDHIGEDAVIARLTRALPSRPDVAVGVGDDCAVVRPPGGGAWELLLTSDPVVEGVHFQPTDAPARIGHKALARVLSDLAAMGGEPLWVLVNVTAPPHESAERLEGIYAGLTALAQAHGVAIVGGDLGAGPVLSLHVFAVGRVPTGQAITRAGGQPGDRLFVTGRLGGSLRSGRHLDFEPRLVEGRWLREGGWVHAMCDLSDGLARDLPRLATSSGVGARIRVADLPVSEAARTGCATEREAQRRALGDGEDFELLFAVSPDRTAALASAWRARFALACTEIGLLTPPGEGVTLTGPDGLPVPLECDGYEHFRTV